MNQKFIKNTKKKIHLNKLEEQTLSKIYIYIYILFN